MNNQVNTSLLDKFTIFIPFDLLLFTRKHWICLLCLFEKSCLCFCLPHDTFRTYQYCNWLPHSLDWFHGSQINVRFFTL